MFVSKRTIRQALTILPAGLCEFSMGIGHGWSAPTVNKLYKSPDDFSLTKDECAWIASLPDLFRAIGTIAVFMTLDVFGRKKSYYVASVVYVLVWLTTWTTRSVWILLAVRSIFGFVVGINDATSPIYIAENSSPEMRGILGSLSISFWFLGLVVSYILGKYLTYNSVAIVNMVFAGFVLSSMILLKEPAQFLIMQGRYDEARKSFFWLRVSETSATKSEFEEMIKTLQQKKDPFWKELGKKASIKSLIIVSTIGFLVPSTGCVAIVGFITTAFSKSSSFPPEDFTIFYGLFQLISILISSSFIERFNRRTLLIAGFFGCGLAHSATAFLYYWQENISDIPYCFWLIFATIATYTIIVAMTAFPAFFTMHGELFPHGIKAFGSCFAVAANSLTAFAVSFMFLEVAEGYGIYYNFVFYAVMSYISVVYVYFFLPETRGKTLCEIEKLFEK